VHPGHAMVMVMDGWMHEGTVNELQTLYDKHMNTQTSVSTASVCTVINIIICLCYV